MNVVIVCTNCKKPLKIPAESQGKKVRCPLCKTVFVGQRDEFKPRPAAEDNETLAFPPPPVTRPPANDALLTDEDAPRPTASGSSIIDPITDTPSVSDAPAPKSSRPAPPPKKKSRLLLILLLLFLFTGLPLLACGGLFLAFGGALFYGISRSADGQNPQPHSEEVRTALDKPTIPDKPVVKPDDDKTQTVKPDDKATKPDDKTQPIKPGPTPIEEEIKNAAAGVKLVPVDVEIGGVPFTVQAPEGTKVVPGFDPEHVFLQKGDGFKLSVLVGRVNMVAARDFWKSERSPDPLKEVLAEGKDLLVSQHQSPFGAKDPLFHFVTNTTLGHLDFHLENDWYDEQGHPYSRESCLLMAHCARTAALKTGYQEPKTAADLEKLGCAFDKNDQGKVKSVGLPGAFSDATLPYLVRVAPDLEYLNLGGTQVGGDGLAAVAGLKNLRNLILPTRPPENAFVGSGFRHLKGLTQLEELQLNYTGVMAADLAPLGSLTALKRLGLAGNGLTGDGLDWLKSLARLEHLVLRGQPFTDAGVGHLKGLKALQELELGNTAVTGATFDALQQAGNLETLVLNGTPVTDAGLQKIAGLRKLTSLQLAETKITDTGLAALKDLTALTFLDLSQTEVTGTGFAALGKLTALTTLRLSESKFGDTGLPHLGKLTGLVGLELVHTPVTGKGFAALKTCKGLVDINLAESECNDAGLAELGACKSLESLVLSQTKVTDAGWKHLKGLENLQALECNETTLTGAGAEALQSLKKLTSLGLYNTKFNDAGLSQLKGVTGLTVLDLNGTAVGDGGLAHLKGLSKLESLSLNKTAVGDGGLDHLKDLKTLKSLSVYETKVTKAGADKLKKALPDLQVYRNDQ